MPTDAIPPEFAEPTDLADGAWSVAVPPLLVSAGAGGARLTIQLLRPTILALPGSHVTVVHDPVGLMGERLLAHVYRTATGASPVAALRWVLVRPSLAAVWAHADALVPSTWRPRRSDGGSRRVAERPRGAAVAVGQVAGRPAGVLLLGESDRPDALSHASAGRLALRAVMRGWTVLAVTRDGPLGARTGAMQRWRRGIARRGVARRGPAIRPGAANRSQHSGCAAPGAALAHAPRVRKRSPGDRRAALTSSAVGPPLGGAERDARFGTSHRCAAHRPVTRPAPRPARHVRVPPVQHAHAPRRAVRPGRWRRPCACTRADRPCTTRRTSATSARSSSRTSCGARCGCTAGRCMQVMNLTDVDDKIIRKARDRAGKTITRGHRTVHRRSSTRTGATCASRTRRSTPRPPRTSREMIALVERAGATTASRTWPTTVRCISRSTASRTTASSRGSTRARSRAARAWRRTTTPRRTRRTSRSGRAAKPEDEATGAAWDSPWGRGRPGWHLECSAMAMKIPRRDVRPARRRHRPHLPAPRGRDRAVARRPPASRSRAAGATASSCSPTARRWPSAWATWQTVVDLREQGDRAARRVPAFHLHDALPQAAQPRRTTRSSSRRRRCGASATSRERLAEATGGTRGAGGRGRREPRQAFRAALFDDLNAPEAMAALFTFITRGEQELDAGGSDVGGAGRGARGVRR